MQRILPVLLVCFLFRAGSHGAVKLIVEAGAFDRENCIVNAPVPAEALPKHLINPTLKSADGKLIPVQIEFAEPPTKPWLCFVLPRLSKGTSAKFEFPGPAFSGPVIEGKREGRKIKISGPDGPLLEYQAEAGELPRKEIREVFIRGGYIHPIFSPSGKMVTDDFPPNHIHHHGVWWSWTKTDFQERHPDFWNMGDGKGRVEFVSVGPPLGAFVSAGFTAEHRFVDLTAPTPVIALNEMWQVKVYNLFDAKRGWIFDLLSTQQCATNAPLKLPEYRYGGIGIRGNRAWNGKGKASWLTSEGEVTKDQGMRGRWCDMSGLIDGAQAGITILSHPNNFRSPQPMRIHPTEPFFCFAPQEVGDMEIAPGTKYISRYRFIVHDGAPDKAFIESVWNDYANPPKVTVGSE